MSNRKWYVEMLTAPALIQRNASIRGDYTFQLFRNDDGNIETLTHSEVYRIVKEISSGLIASGFRKGDRAAVICSTLPQWMWCDYGILCAGGVTVSIYPTLPEKEIEFILKDSGSTILFVENEQLVDLARKICRPANRNVKVKKIILMKGEWSGRDKSVFTLDAVRKSGVDILVKKRMAFEERWRSVGFSDLMTIVYTSGTTGNPKGVVHTHFSFASAVTRDCNVVNFADADNGDMFISFLPMAHTYERECGHGAAMQVCLPIAYSSPKTLVEDLKIFKPTIFMSVPRIYERVYMAMREKAAESPLKKKIFDAAVRTGISVIEKRSDSNGFVDMSEGIDLTKGAGLLLKLKFMIFDLLVFRKVREAFGGRFRFAFSAAGSLNPDLCKTFLAMGIRVTEGYGATETWNDVTVNRLDKILPGSVGSKSTSAVEWKVANDGEFLVKGDFLFSGYWNNPGATKGAFTDDGFYKTGDIVEVLQDGYIRIIDRKKGLMVLDTGKNVSSQRIESLFSLSRYIELAVPVGTDRKYVTAIVVPNFDAFISFFKRSGISFNSSELVYSDEISSVPVCVKVGRDFVENEIFRKIIDDEIRGVNRELQLHEQIRRFHVTDYRFSESTGELTPTLKVKRGFVTEKFKKEIEGLYR